jgi:hypothetical protein
VPISKTTGAIKGYASIKIIISVLKKYAQSPIARAHKKEAAKLRAINLGALYFVI